MKKLLFVVLALFVFSVRADNTITSKEYVDTQVSNLQTQIPAKNANTVLTNTGTAGTVGEKAIYNSNNDYAEQQDALVTAGAFNSAVQNALESEFVCIEWQGSTHDNAHCLLYEVQNAYHKSKNLFDSNQLLEAPGWVEENGVYTGMASDMFNTHGHNRGFVFQQAFKPNTRYTLSYTMSGSGNDGLIRARFVITYTDGIGRDVPYVASGETKHVVITTPADKTISYIWFTYGEEGRVSISNVQLEEGATATPYQPYGENTYLPQN
ncbi:MAG: hypothetical protein J5611_02660 [Alphaproteobacteria bacterium]|nr:hypothetical protein [Alphaproteobacteria bacterium]